MLRRHGLGKASKKKKVLWNRAGYKEFKKLVATSNPEVREWVTIASASSVPPLTRNLDGQFASAASAVTKVDEIPLRDLPNAALLFVLSATLRVRYVFTEQRRRRRRHGVGNCC